MTTGTDQPVPIVPGLKAQQEWRPGDSLERPDQALVDHALAGKQLDLVGDNRVDHQAMSEWGPERTVQAAVLRHLLVNLEWPVHTRGVRLRGVRISGRLDLESATVRCPLLLEDCFLDSPDSVVFDYATVSRIVLSRCRVVGGLTADLLVATKELDFQASAFENVVRMLGADITGQLSFGGAKLTGTDSNGTAFLGDEIKVGHAVFFDQGFIAAGAVRLLDADISGQLSFNGAKLTGTDSDGIALFGDRVKAGANMTFNEGFIAAGAVRLLGADITGQLSFSGAKLTGTDSNGIALSGEGMKVTGDVFLNQEFTSAGALSVAGAHIDGSVWLGGAELAEPVALEAPGLHVGGQLHWTPRSPVLGLVNLEQAAVQRLDDDWSLPHAHWPPAGQLRLVGFNYDGFGGRQQASWKQRLDWIRRSHTTATASTTAEFAAQPYEQLIRVYRQTGQESDARQVAIARRNDLRRFGDLTGPQGVGNWLLDKTIKHGYQPLRAVVLLAAVYLVVLLVAWGAQHHDSVIVPAKSTKDIDPVPTAVQCSPGYSCFYPAGYAVDVVVPIINLRQAENWRVDGQAPWGWAYLAVGWVATGLGWAFTTLAVAGYTGLVRKE